MVPAMRRRGWVREPGEDFAGEEGDGFDVGEGFAGDQAELEWAGGRAGVGGGFGGARQGKDGDLGAGNAGADVGFGFLRGVEEDAVEIGEEGGFLAEQAVEAGPGGEGQEVLGLEDGAEQGGVAPGQGEHELGVEPFALRKVVVHVDELGGRACGGGRRGRSGRRYRVC